MVVATGVFFGVVSFMQTVQYHFTGFTIVFFIN